jgi:hypothetical protein
VAHWTKHAADEGLPSTNVNINATMQTAKAIRAPHFRMPSTAATFCKIPLCKNSADPTELLTLTLMLHLSFETNSK